ncbi:hypothetical protein ACFPA1_11585 [Neobacillus sp. GCM10023253]|uniref:hypothetical protein n=1 Tax=Neobacillus sp. GCM10023253 TaxID=3252644 RepID=UPI003620943E
MNFTNKGSASVTIPKPKPVVLSPIEVKIIDAKSVAISLANQTTGTQPDQYKVFVNNVLKATQASSSSATQTATITDLQPGVYTIRIEGWYKDELTSQRSISVTIPKPEPAVFSPIEVTVDQHLVTRIDYSKTNLQTNQYKIYQNGKEVSIEKLPDCPRQHWLYHSVYGRIR